MKVHDFKPLASPSQNSPSMLTEFEKTIPGVAELLPWFGNDGSQPFGNGASVHGGLEGAEHEMEGLNVFLAHLGNLIFQAAQTGLVQDGRHTFD